MDIEPRTIQDELNSIVDEFDQQIYPRTVWRNNNNKLYLCFKAIGAGFSLIRDIVLSLKYRFDARYCSDSDLESAMLITGEKRQTGKVSMLRMILSNTDDSVEIRLRAGTYFFNNTDGEVFRYQLATDIVIAPQGYEVALFSSINVGAFAVTGIPNAVVYRMDGLSLPLACACEALENSASLGRLPESDFEVRQRILTDTTRQDTLKELESAIRALPTIYECNLLFNESNMNAAPLENGIVLGPKELLIIITGTPTTELAETVVAKEIYKTKMVTFEQVVWYENPLFLNGRYPVYYKFHDKRQFYLTIHYKYDRSKLQQVYVDTAFNLLLNKYRVMTTHIDEINEPMLYEALREHGLTGVALKKIYIQDMENGVRKSVELIKIPRFAMAELAGVSFIAEAYV